uniref:Matrix metallopeptidase 17b n=1 Tax=Eptatretus burgeri TaxID=7764 RepID=A0A8C4WYT0_EPTBU
MRSGTNKPKRCARGAPVVPMVVGVKFPAVPLTLLLFVSFAASRKIIDENDMLGGMDWMTRFGYLKQPDPLSGKLMSKDAISDAIKEMQRFGGLKVTGKLDKDTALLMNKPRCSLPDIIGSSEMVRRRRRRYALTRNKWHKKDITWKVQSFPPASHIARANVKQILLQAFSSWEAVTHLVFHEVSHHQNADIVVDFTNRYHMDAYPFDGIGGTLAHAFFPGSSLAGDTHFDNDEEWKEYPDSRTRGTDLFAVAVHEFGHALGLAHSSSPSAIMQPYYSGAVGPPGKFNLPEDDVRGIQRLYGKKHTSKPQKPHKPPYVPLPRPPKHPNPRTPDRCTTSFDAVAEIRGEIFFFKGGYFWRVMRGHKLENEEAMPIHSFWIGIPKDLARIDAMFERSIDQKIIIISGKQFWQFTANQADRGYPQPITYLGLPSEGITGVLEWKHNGVVYLFHDSKYWRYDMVRRQLMSGYPQPISRWGGVPPNVKGTVNINDDASYFFFGQQYWKIINKNVEVAPHYPKNIGISWLQCPGGEHFRNKGHGLSPAPFSLVFASLVASVLPVLLNRWFV